MGRLHLLVFGPDGQPLPQVTVTAGESSAQTSDDGTAALALPAELLTIRLSVPKALLPAVPTEDPEWRVELADIPIIDGETTELIVTLSESGAIAGLDLQAAEGAAHSLQKEFEKAQQEKPQGQVTGVVTAAEGGGAIEGARIYVRGAPVEASSKADGSFKLELPEGTYQLSVIHPRFSTQSVPDVAVRGGETTKADVALSPASVELEELVVTAPHIEGGIATLVAERRETTAVADVIGAEQIARSGDSNAAAALSRVTGLTLVDGKFIIVRGMGERYSSLLLNRLQIPSPDPTRRVVPLDLFPTGVIDSVVVQKTYSPDMPGEFGGGVVQLRSRSYPEEFLLGVTVSGGGNSQSTFRDRLTYEGGKYDWLGVDDGTRALPDPFDDPRGKLPYPANKYSAYSADEVEALGESLPNIYTRKSEWTPPDASVVASVGNTFDLRIAKLGFVAAGGYKNDYSTVEGAFNRTWSGSQGGSILDDYRTDTYRRQVSLSGFLDWGVEFSKNQTLKATTMLLRQTDDGTLHLNGFDDNLGVDIDQTTLSWVEREVLLQQATGHHQFSQLHDFGVDWRYAWARATRDEPDRREYTYGDLGADGGYTLDLDDGNSRVFSQLDDSTHEVSFDLTQPFPVWSELSSKLKAGGLFYYRDRTAETRRFTYALTTGLDASRPLEELLTPEHIGEEATFREITQPTDAYDAKMTIQAAYGMLELPLAKSLDLMAGARIEHAVIEVTTVDPFDRTVGAVKAELDNVDVLPAGTLTFRFLEDFQLRGGYSRTLNRPDFRELSESRYYDLETNTLFKGNAEVQRAVIDNYDVRLEWYYTSDETLSLAGFYKSFDQPIEIEAAAATEDLYTTINSPSARSAGIEFEARKRFDFVGEALDSLYLATNFTWIDSEVEVEVQDGSTYHRPLQSQSPWVVNAQLGWDDAADDGSGTAASLLYNIAGRRIRGVGDPDKDIPDTYEEPFSRLDFAFSQRLPHGFTLGAKARNLLNPVQRWYKGDVLVRRFRRGIDASINLAWKY